ncbi:flagellar protein FliT [Nitrosomonas sp.]|uniref:flagellar protein FliT n=1 Tax=Nitrosomonas sp. TaxID=42353 RepID=UPI0025D92B34|nr:flagellar protein FliT [Nitrosomonas sp.]MCC6916207.1 flagellar protein FliT [Nitrosomonas sp.]
MNPDNSSEPLPGNSRNDMQMIAAYEEILAITDRMLQAAKNSNWDELVALELDCKQLTARLMTQNAREQLSEEQKQKKVGLIHGILERDAEIRAITEPWMAQLQNRLTSSSQQRKLEQTYQKDL